MSATGEELEVKFYLTGLAALEEKLWALGAKRVQERVYEANLRFDTQDGALTRQFRVLRLRQDSAARLTYKGPGAEVDGVRARTELEFVVSDFAMARAFLEALGYVVSVMYEKYRATYALEMPVSTPVEPVETRAETPVEPVETRIQVLVTLDEMPYGYFAEIEGPDGASIRAAAEKLGLDWEARVLDSYLMIFDRLRARRGLAFRDLSFANFSGVTVTAEELGVRNATDDR